MFLFTSYRPDIYQQKYLAHQERKKKILTSNYGVAKWRKYTPEEQKLFFDILKNRVSQRSFNREPVDVDFILKQARMCPSSCSRQGIDFRVVGDRDLKDLLGGLLVGGVGWIHRANAIILLEANELAYKAGDEINFMPYLDAGIIAHNIYLICEVLGVGACFVNPNVRVGNITLFNERFLLTNHKFVGAIAIGNYDKKHT